MKQTKTPLSQEQRSEIWKSFWLHAVGALVVAVLSTVFLNIGAAPGLPFILTMIISGIPTFLVWSSFVIKIEKYRYSTGIPYPSTYIVLAIASALMIVGPLVLFVSLLIRLSRVPRLEQLCEEQDTRPAPTPRSAPATSPTPLSVPQKQPPLEPSRDP